MHIGWCNGTWPAQPKFVVARFCNHSNGARYTNAIRAHGDHRLLAILVEHFQVECFCVFATELKHVANFNTAVDAHGRSAMWASITGTHFCCFNGSIACKVATVNKVDDVLTFGVCASNPRRTLYNASVEKVANARGTRCAQYVGADVALY